MDEQAQQIIYKVFWQNKKRFGKTESVLAKQKCLSCASPNGGGPGLS